MEGGFGFEVRLRLLVEYAPRPPGEKEKEREREREREREGSAVNNLGPRHEPARSLKTTKRTHLRSSSVQATDFYNQEPMRQAESMVPVSRILLGLSQHPHETLLNTMIDCLEAGAAFNISLKGYEEMGKDAEARIRADPHQAELFRIAKYRKQTRKLLAEMDQSLKELTPEGLPESLIEIQEPELMPFKLNLMTTWETTSDMLVDAVDLAATKMSERLKGSLHKLKDLAGPYWQEDARWHAGVPKDADLKTVLAKGLVTGSCKGCPELF